MSGPADRDAELVLPVGRRSGIEELPRVESIVSQELV